MDLRLTSNVAKPHTLLALTPTDQILISYIQSTLDNLKLKGPEKNFKLWRDSI